MRPELSNETKAQAKPLAASSSGIRKVLGIRHFSENSFSSSAARFWMQVSVQRIFRREKLDLLSARGA